MGGNSYFTSYHSALKRVLFTEMLDEHIQRQQKRRLSIVGPCFTHEQWLLLQADRRRAQADDDRSLDDGTGQSNSQ